MRMTWIPIGDSPDYFSACTLYRATYRGTVRGHACYWVHRADLPKSQRTLARALHVGGLPDRVTSERTAEER